MRSQSPIIAKAPFFLGNVMLEGISTVGKVLVLLWKVISRIPQARLNPKLTIQQMMSVGFHSIPLLFVTSLFTGAVAAVQAEYQFRNFIPEKFIGTAIAKMVFIELGPILTALVLAGRVGSALAAEIASMKNKEELSAMEVLGLDVHRYLGVPRFIAFVVMVPSLTIFSSFLAIIGGWIVCVLALDITSYTYLTGLRYMFDNMDLISGIVKSVIFGATIFILGYYFGEKSEGGAQGVGEATKNTVVASSVVLLFFDLIVAVILFS